MIELITGELRMSLGEIRQGDIFRTLEAVSGVGPWLKATADASSRRHYCRPGRKVWLVPSTPAPL